jgi:hypothetical protein
MLPPFKLDCDEARQRVELFSGSAPLRSEADREDPDQRLVEHWQRLFAKNRSRKVGSA